MINACTADPIACFYRQYTSTIYQVSINTVGETAPKTDVQTVVWVPGFRPPRKGSAVDVESNRGVLYTPHRQYES